MLPATWKNPPCRNIEVKIVKSGAAGPRAARHEAVSRHGTSPNSRMKACAGPRARARLPPPARTGRGRPARWPAIRPMVTIGVLRDGVVVLEREHGPLRRSRGRGVTTVGRAQVAPRDPLHVLGRHRLDRPHVALGESLPDAERLEEAVVPGEPGVGAPIQRELPEQVGLGARELGRARGARGGCARSRPASPPPPGPGWPARCRAARRGRRARSRDG